MRNTIILVDTFGYFFRSYYALPSLQNSKHFPTSLLTGFSHFLFNLYKENPNTCIIFALEGSGINRRKEIYPLYKANRQEAPKDLLLQLPIAIEWLEKMQIPQVTFDGYEADDCIASLANLAISKGLEVQIISHDKDLYQLINEQISLFDYTRKRKITAKECQEKFGVLPHEFITYQSIVGDSSDNIPGIRGIGTKGAQRILAHFKDLSSLYETLHNDESKLVALFGKRITNLIAEHEDLAYLSRSLVTLRTDLLADYDFFALQNDNNPMPLLKIQPELEEYELHKILSYLVNYQPELATQEQAIQRQSNAADSIKGHKEQIPPISPNNTNNKFHFVSHALTDSEELFKILESIPKETVIAYDCETDGLNVRENRIVGFSFCFDGINGYYVPFLHGIAKEEKQETLLDTTHDSIKQISIQEAKQALEILFSHTLVGHNIKFDIGMAWHNFGILPTRPIKDSMILAWLLNSHQSVSLDNLMREYFGHQMIAFDDIVAKGETFDRVAIEVASQYASEDAVATYQLYNRLESLCPPDLLRLANDVEYPFILTLCFMEDSGIAIDREYFLNLKQEFTKKLHSLQQQIYQECGHEFNINSPKQLAEVLFHHLKLDSTHNKSLSTNEAVLQNLLDSHPVISSLLHYREAFKLLSTYIEPLLKLSKTQHRVYTSFIQTGTNTGRLSSKSPNLQNIPVRSELGKNIRAGFVAEHGNMLVSLDYSQIELRLLAHFSQDSSLIESFNNDADIHAETAKKIFQAEFENTDSDKRVYLRSAAKSINFGLIYGMGARKLAQTLRISNTEAKKYIQSYFASFPTVKKYLEYKKEEILQKGYSETLLGRRRCFDFLNATEFMRQNFLREGVNAIFQGSAADLIKLSMNAIFKNLADFHIDSNSREVYPKARMLLQVHDELIFEIEESRVKNLAYLIKEVMENVYHLEVPLVCNIAFGKSWADLK
ncbi:DNA polymerase I [Helicobacter aurati]|uniref:DNA polymerase I n=1 Tax=Helicobacter aurati TaxID=137778 RepID=A0A3D8J5V3_9HELI|nr:DNA polymerase I [Helicobacter aurati]RDU72869.1 DNA polymerase I [Helicobacter aurati]